MFNIRIRRTVQICTTLYVQATSHRKFETAGRSMALVVCDVVESIQCVIDSCPTSRFWANLVERVEFWVVELDFSYRNEFSSIHLERSSSTQRQLLVQKFIHFAII